MTILDEIASYAHKRVIEYKADIELAQMMCLAYTSASRELEANKLSGITDSDGSGRFTYPFYDAIKQEGLSFICEVKRASPSKGLISDDYPFLDIAKDYENANAQAISCLTEPKWFLGFDEHLMTLATNLNTPILRKDFIVDEYMVYQAKVLGANAILLICAILSDSELKAFSSLAESLGMSVLFEAHDELEINRALEAGAKIIGVNNRNLHDFSVDFDNAYRMRKLVPNDILFVAESGVKTVEDIKRVSSMGADAALIGETLMRSDNRENLLKTFQSAAKTSSNNTSSSLTHSEQQKINNSNKYPQPVVCKTSCLPLYNKPYSFSSTKPAVKFCGLCNILDIDAFNETMPDFVGFVFWKPSKRAVTLSEALKLRANLKSAIVSVGVFVDAPIREVAFAYKCGAISIAQLHGNESEAYISSLREIAPGITIWKSFELQKNTAAYASDAQGIFEQIEASSADLVLLDAGKGEGKAFNWKCLERISRPYALAGGLDVQSVSDAIALGVRPVLFDVSSGIECNTSSNAEKNKSSPRKDLSLMKSFLYSCGR